jgi:signal peptidase I
MAVYFSIFLVIVTVLTGIVWLVDKFYLAGQRQLKLVTAQQQCNGGLSDEVAEKITEPSAFIDTSVQVFPVIAFVLILRSFLWEPFQIPSGSMMPTLLDGDFILVNKFNYGLRDPVTQTKFLKVGEPQRGDVFVFKYPNDPKIDYIKRVIGLPGDRIIYRNKTLYIKPACTDTTKKCPGFTQIVTNFKKPSESPDGSYGLHRYTEFLLNKTHDILIDPRVLPRTQIYCSQANGRLCQQAGTQQDEFVVPQGHYFAMGDNRDNSADSRYWGFVPEENIVGQAVFIWMSFDFERTPDDFLPHWIPTGVRFSRLGPIN